MAGGNEEGQAGHNTKMLHAAGQSAANHFNLQYDGTVWSFCLSAI